MLHRYCESEALNILFDVGLSRIVSANKFPKLKVKYQQIATKRLLLSGKKSVMPKAL